MSAPGCPKREYFERKREDSPANTMMDRPGGIEAATRFECKVCWHVYDPAQGDPVWQVPPATAFSELPAHWTCPVCSTPRDGFLVLRDDD